MVTGRPVRTVYHSDLKALLRASRDEIESWPIPTMRDVLHGSAGMLDIEGE